MKTPPNDDIGRHHLAQYILHEYPDIGLTYNDLLDIYENPETGDKDFKRDWENGFSRCSGMLASIFTLGRQTPS